MHETEIKGNTRCVEIGLNLQIAPTNHSGLLRFPLIEIQPEGPCKYWKNTEDTTDLRTCLT